MQAHELRPEPPQSMLVPYGQGRTTRQRTKGTVQSACSFSQRLYNGVKGLGVTTTSRSTITVIMPNSNVLYFHRAHHRHGRYHQGLPLLSLHVDLAKNMMDATTTLIREETSSEGQHARSSWNEDRSTMDLIAAGSRMSYVVVAAPMYPECYVGYDTTAAGYT